MTGHYRQVAILATVFNQLGSNLLVLLMIHVLNIQLICGYSLLAGNGLNISISVKIVFFLSFINGILALNLVFGFCANVYQLSIKYLKRLRMNAKVKVDGKGNRLLYEARKHRRMLRSMPPIKISFGAMNFIDKLTPVIFQQFATARLIDSVLLTKS